MDPDFAERNIPHLISHFELNDLVRNLNLSKIQAEILASRLKGWNLLPQGVKSVKQGVKSVIQETSVGTVFIIS